MCCQKGENVYTGANDAEWISKGIYNTYQNQNLRYSQVVPLTMFDEKNSDLIFRHRLIFMLRKEMPINSYSLQKVADRK